MANYVTITSDKSKIVALLLCVFLGILGFHRFYVGQSRNRNNLFVYRWHLRDWLDP